MTQHATSPFDEVIDRRASDSLKWSRYRDRDVLPLWVADMDFRSPPAVIKALEERVAHGVYGYGLPPTALIDAIQRHLANDFSWDIQPDWLVWLPGVVTGLNLACRSVGTTGDEVVTLVPVYPPFLSAPRLSQRQLVTVRLTQQPHHWEIDFDQLERAITPRTRLILLCNPHNPVGRVFSRSELEQLAELAIRYDLVICSDEIHAGLVLATDTRHIPIASVAPEVASRTISLQAPSKTFNIPGLGCAFAVISDPVLRHRYRQSMEQIVPHVNILGLTAAWAAYQHGGEWLRDLLVYLRGNQDIVLRAIQEMPGLKATSAEATYLTWIDARGTGFADPADFFLQGGVALSNGADFDGDGFVRLNFGCPRALLIQALERMKTALAAR